MICQRIEKNGGVAAAKNVTQIAIQIRRVKKLSGKAHFFSFKETSTL